MAAKLEQKPELSLRTKISRRMVYRGELADLDAKVKALDKELLDEIGTGYEDDRYKVDPVPGTSAERISKELLVKYGVSAKIIRKATIPGTKYRYPRITDKVAAAAAKEAKSAHVKK